MAENINTRSMKTQAENDLLLTILKADESINHGDISSAEKIIKASPAGEISNSETIVQLGELALRSGLYFDAVSYFRKASDLHPDNAYNLYKQAEILLAINLDANELHENIIQCRELLNKSISLDKKYIDPYLKLAKLEIKLNNFLPAIELLEKANHIKQNDYRILLELIHALSTSNRHSEALIHAKKLVNIYPNRTECHQQLGRIYIELGKTEDAIKHFEKAIQLDKTAGLSYLYLSAVRKFNTKDCPLINRIESNLQLSLAPTQRYYIHFALGKMHDDCKDREKAFEHYQKGNLLCKSASDPQTDNKTFNEIRKIYTKKILLNTHDYGNPSEIPVFVIGMPRSGSTLIEQIISSHPEGGGAGEMFEIDNIEKLFITRGQKNNYLYDLKKNLTRENIDIYTIKYLEVLRKNREHAKRIVDKMPDNFMHLGLINILFPNARIIHSVRNPLDTCLSCYFQAFAGHPWSYDLKWIARRYQVYRKTMAYWQATLPPGKIIDIHYEHLTENPQTRTRELITFCGLDWDDRCLEFYKEKRAINTASLWQARQPIYTSSRKRWHNYALHLRDLAQGLADYLSDEDLAELAQHGIQIKKRSAWKWW